MAGPWLKYRGHLDNISNNMFIGYVNCLYSFRRIQFSVNAFIRFFLKFYLMTGIKKLVKADCPTVWIFKEWDIFRPENAKIQKFHKICLLHIITDIHEEASLDFFSIQN